METTKRLRAARAAPGCRVRRSEQLRCALADERSGKVVFVSHCLLNENARYPGGAFRPGAVLEVVEPYLRDGIGICQMPCPEQVAWGGVGKRHLVRVWGRPGMAVPVRRGLGVFQVYTRVRYRLLARRVARQIADLRAGGVEVMGIVGVGGSPSCGVATTLDLSAAAGPVVGCPLARLDRQVVNGAVAAAMRPGPGVFACELDRALTRRHIDVAWLEHDLRSEWPSQDRPPGAVAVTLVRPVVRASPAMLAAARRVLGRRFDAADVGRLIDRARVAVPSAGRDVPAGLNRGGRHLLVQGTFVMALYDALLAAGVTDDDATALVADVVFETNRAAHEWLHRLAALWSRDPWARLRWQSRVLCRFYYRPPAWELEEVAVPGGYGLDVTRCAVADHFRRHGLGPLCERTLCVQDERVARVHGEPAGIAFVRTGTIAGGAERCDFRYRPAGISAGHRSAGPATDPPIGS